jgi:glycosyltransferase involved in cell wall biosynthesis
MRIAHLSTSRSGGAALASLRYSNALKSVGVSNDLYALGDGSDNESTRPFSIPRSPLETLQSKALTLVQRKIFQVGSTLLTPISLQPRSIAELVNDYDLIHFHSTYNILNSRGLKRVIESGKKIVITLHDQRWFTGGCHYSGDCENYISGCKKCPEATILGKLFVANSFATYENAWKSDSRIKVISPSQWLSDKAFNSRMLLNAKVFTIRNPVPTPSAKKLSTKVAINAKAPNPQRKIVFISDNLQNPLKGLKVLLSAFQQMNEIEKAQYKLLLIGNNPPKGGDFPVSTQIVNGATSEELLDYLQGQDLLVVPSLQDNLPNVIGEAFSLGVKVIGSNTGGIPEVINSAVGAVFENQNHEDLASKLRNFDYSYSPEIVRDHFNENFSYEIVGNQIANLYKE